MDLNRAIKSDVEAACDALFGAPPDALSVQPTRPEFEGSHTVVCFPLASQYRRRPDELAKQIGEYLVVHSAHVTAYQAVKGFLNITLSDSAWVAAFHAVAEREDFGVAPPNGREIVMEYSSPNTNKPLHLGHLRNNFLGAAMAALYTAQGYTVHKVQIINDRGIHICKSMAAWLRVGRGETPEQASLKGDKLVGAYYVEFNRIHRREQAELEAAGRTPQQAEKEAPIMRQAVHLLRRWEEQDPEVRSLWKTMNEWVYAGFEATYQRMGVRFDKLYFESDTYLLGKQEALKGLEKGLFFREQDGSVWVDLADQGLDKKILLRADGTSVYMTQDIGTAILRYRDFPRISAQIYTVGSEQDYHFKALFLILKKLGYPWANACYHLSYGMVDLPSGKMKSREGTVVDADDLMEEMVQRARAQTRALGKVDDMPEDKRRQLVETIGIGALKYYLLKVDPRKRIVFNPDESIQLQGHTGPFIQYTYARICSVLRKAPDSGYRADISYQEAALLPAERELIHLLTAYPAHLKEAAATYNPAVVANYAYELAKRYNRFYQTVPIFGAESPALLALRVALSRATAKALKSAMAILQMGAPERM